MDQGGPYKMAPELHNPARQIISEYHPYLSDAKIAYLFRSGRWKSKDTTQLGKAIVAPQVWRSLTGYDLVLVVNEVIYYSLSDKGKLALLDHVISFFREPVSDSKGSLSYATREHDIKEFSDVVKRHNVCFSNLRAIEEDGTRQLSLQSLAAEIENAEQIEEVMGTQEVEEETIEIEELDEADYENLTVKQQFNFDD